MSGNNLGRTGVARVSRKRMRLHEDTLIEQLRVVARKGGPPTVSEVRQEWRSKPAPPVAEAEMLEAETKLGFPLPPLLRRLYLEVSNGDFGPGLLKLGDPGASDYWSLVSWYVEGRSITQEEIDAVWGTEEEDRPTVWPEKLLSICDWGCNIYSCVDCSKSECPVLRNDNNVSFRTLALEAPSLHEWLESWLDGKELFWLDWEKAERVTF
jgi:hypothetical protein